MKTEKQLYQWDVGQKLIECAGLYVDFPIGEDIYRVETADGTCIIPDELLQKSSVHKIYECMADNTLREFVFNVKSRPKPPDYVYTPTERLTFEGLVQRVDDAVADIVRRADSGEFDGYTPVKGTDYFTTAEIQQIQNEVSSGAIGEFKSVVDTETETFNTNAESKLTTYNENDVAKTGAYNTNASNKVTEYNSNAENKTAEFDTHTEQIQADISELKSDLTGLQTVVDSKADASDLVKTNLYLDALYKLNIGQTYDVLEQESEAYSVDVPSGAKYVGVDKVGGKSVVWNQLIKSISDTKITGGTISLSDGIATFTASESGNQAYNTFPCIDKHKYFAKAKFKTSSATADVKVRVFSIDIQGIESTEWQTCSSIGSVNGSGYLSVSVVDRRTSGFDAIDIAYFVVFDLTQMFGAGNEPSTVEEFEAMFPADYYPYSEPTIISSQTDRVDVARADSSITQQITTGFPVLNSAGSVYDYIDIDNGKLHRRVGVVDMGTLGWVDNGGNFRTIALANIANLPKSNETTINALCNKFISKPWVDRTIDKAIYGYYASIEVKDSSYTDATAFKTAMNGVMLYYELAEEIITDIEIPKELTDWLTVEAGGSVTFHNADEGKRLLVPNKLSFVRKLDEVSV